jgi:ketosteroid isomerase-like protein
VNEDLRPTLDRLELLELEGAYARAYDSQDGEAWAELFTVDGVYQSRPAEDTPTNLVHGREQLRAFASNQPASGVHMIHTPTLTIRGDEATGRAHFQFRSVGREGRAVSQREVTGCYDVRYVRTPQGWRIARRVTTYLELVQRRSYAYEADAPDLSPLPDEPSGAFTDGRA